MRGDFWFGAGKEGRRMVLLTVGYAKRKWKEENEEGSHVGAHSLPGLLGLQEVREVRAKGKSSFCQEKLCDKGRATLGPR